MDTLPDDYINALKAIIQSTENNPYTITSAMTKAEEDGRMDAYYTFEAALAYYTYTKIINKPGMETPIQNLLNNMKDNLEKLSSYTNK